MAFRSRADVGQHRMLAWYICSFVIFQGIRTSIAKETYILRFFRGGGPDPLSPSGFAHGKFLYLVAFVSVILLINILKLSYSLYLFNPLLDSAVC